MNISSNSQAIILLTAHFSSPKNEAYAPLSISEWARFAKWLKEHRYVPADLLGHKLEEILSFFQDKSVGSERVRGLLQRGNAFALAMERWSRVGIWVITRADEVYPKSLKEQLKHNAPPLLYGCGDVSLLNASSRKLAVVGSRKADIESLQYAEVLGGKAANQHISIVSGAAKGIDEMAMLGSLEQGGRAIGVVASELGKIITQAQWRKYLVSKQLVLVSPNYPEAKFSVGLAMGRNKYIYCLSDSAIVVHADIKGGTITGAQENLKKSWVPLWVRNFDDAHKALSALIMAGARLFPKDISLDMQPLFSEVLSLRKGNFLLQDGANSQIYLVDAKESNKNLSQCVEDYATFVEQFKNFLQEPRSLDELKKQTSIPQKQLLQILQQAIQKEQLIKTQKPVRYMLCKQDILC